MIGANTATSRGAAIAIHIQNVVQHAVDTWPSIEENGSGSQSRFCLSLWASVVTDGSTISQLAAQHAPPRSSAEDLRRYEGRLKSLMSAGGNRPSAGTQSAIEHLKEELAANLEGTLLASGFSPAGASATLAWRGLRQRREHAACDLLRTLASTAVDHEFPIEVLRENPGPLLAALRPIAANGPDFRRLIKSVTSTGLCTSRTTSDGSTTLRVTREAKVAIDAATTEKERREATASLLRCLTIGIPHAAHEQATWDDWDQLLPHLLACVYACVESALRSQDCIYLLERAAAFLRCGRIDPDAGIVIGEQALALAEASGIPDAGDYANALGNLGICLRQLGRPLDAVDLLQQSATVTAAAGVDTYQHVEALVNLADALADAGRHQDAVTTFEEAVEIADKAYLAHNEDPDRDVLIEALNDFASHLLLHSDAQLDRVERYEHAAEMLDRAQSLLRRGDYGWTSIVSNRAEAHLQLGQHAAGIDLLTEEMPHCERTFGRDSYPYFTMVTGMLDLQEAIGNRREKRRLLALAHDIDDHLASPAQGRTQNDT